VDIIPCPRILECIVSPVLPHFALYCDLCQLAQQRAPLWWKQPRSAHAAVRHFLTLCMLQLSNVIEVIQGTVETVELPENIIVSEWMGYFLMRESMLDSVIIARDKFLKEGGSMYPSHARMLMVPLTSLLQPSSACIDAGCVHNVSNSS
jgi:hypothetical protein